MGIDGRLDTGRFIDFLKRLLHGAERPVFLVVDGHPVHQAKSGGNFVEPTAEMLELYDLPPYLPELNPAEHVWSQVKHHTIGNQFIARPDQLRTLTRTALRRLQKLPTLVASFFHASSTRYAGMLPMIGYFCTA
jgi:transposase